MGGLSNGPIPDPHLPPKPQTEGSKSPFRSCRQTLEIDLMCQYQAIRNTSGGLLNELIPDLHVLQTEWLQIGVHGLSISVCVEDLVTALAVVHNPFANGTNGMVQFSTPYRSILTHKQAGSRIGGPNLTLELRPNGDR